MKRKKASVMFLLLIMCMNLVLPMYVGASEELPIEIDFDTIEDIDAVEGDEYEYFTETDDNDQQEEQEASTLTSESESEVLNEEAEADHTDDEDNEQGSSTTPKNGKQKDEEKTIVLFKGNPNKELIANSHGTTHHEFDNIPALAVTIPSHAIKGLMNNPNVVAVEKNEQYYIQSQTTPWGIESVDAPRAWSNNFTGKGVKVAIIDSGIDISHPDLNVVGCYGASDALTCEDEDGHGTHVAGIIGAKDNNIGVVGVAPEVDIYAARVSDNNGEIMTTNLIEAIDWAISENVDIINLSLGSPKYSSILDVAITKATNEGILVVAAAGNDSADSVIFPAALSNVIAVSAIDKNNYIAPFSNTGVEIEVTAPGVSIYSTHLHNYYTRMDGTSMASPHVAGILALLKVANPDMGSKELRNILRDTAIDLGPKGRDSQFGYGLVQAPTEINNDQLEFEEKVYELQIGLQKLGFFLREPNGKLDTKTKIAIRDFQNYYGLEVIETNEEITLGKIEEVLTNSLQQGRQDDDLLDLKKKMNWLGYGPILVTPYFGAYTEQKVREFQTNYELPVSGMIESVTREKIEQQFSNTFQKGGSHSSIKDLKKALGKAGFGGILLTNFYGSFTEKRVSEFQNYYRLETTGKVNIETISKLEEIISSSFQLGERDEGTIELKRNLNRLGFDGILATDYYGSFTKRRVEEFQAYYGLQVNGIGDEVTLAKIAKLVN